MGQEDGEISMEPKEEGLDAHLHVLGFEDDAVRTLPYAPQDAVLLHGPLPGTLTLRSHSPSLASDASALARPRLPPQTRLPRNGAETSARAWRPRATRNGVLASQCLSLGPRHHASVRFTSRSHPSADRAGGSDGHRRSLSPLPSTT